MITEESMRLAASYLSGDASPEERKIFESWLDESPDHHDLFKEIKKIWEHSSLKFKMAAVETASEWKRLAARIEREESRSGLKLFFSWHALKIAASLIVILVAYFAIKTRVNERTMTLVESGTKEKTFYLPDSSEVWLRSGSTLSYKQDFGKEIREVQLHGEGRFVVTPDATHPFFVISETAVVEVVGTIFNVREDSVVTVTVEEGIVKLYTRELREEAVKLKQGDKAYLKKHKGAKPVKIDNQDHGKPSSRSNNSLYNKETKNPLSYLSVKFTWRKNQFNQSVIDGTIFNTATLASYKNVVLKIVYTKSRGKKVTIFITIYEQIAPGARLEFRKNLVDIFSNTKDLKVTIDQVEIDESLH